MDFQSLLVAVVFVFSFIISDTVVQAHSVAEETEFGNNSQGGSQDGSQGGYERRYDGALEMALANIGASQLLATAQRPSKVRQLDLLALRNDVLVLNAQQLQGRLQTNEQVTYVLATHKTIHNNLAQQAREQLAEELGDATLASAEQLLPGEHAVLMKVDQGIVGDSGVPVGTWIETGGLR